MKRIKVLGSVLKRTRADKIIIGFIVFIYLNEKLNSGFGPNARVKGVRTKSWTKLLFLNYVYTEMDSFHPTIF